MQWGQFCFSLIKCYSGGALNRTSPFCFITPHEIECSRRATNKPVSCIIYCCYSIHFFSVFHLRRSVSFLCVFLPVLRDPRFGNLANLKPIYPRQLLLSVGAEPSTKPVRCRKVFSVDSERPVACCDVFTSCHTSTFFVALSAQRHSDLKIPFVSAE